MLVPFSLFLWSLLHSLFISLWDFLISSYLQYASWFVNLQSNLSYTLSSDNSLVCRWFQDFFTWVATLITPEFTSHGERTSLLHFPHSQTSVLNYYPSIISDTSIYFPFHMVEFGVIFDFSVISYFEMSLRLSPWTPFWWPLVCFKPTAFDLWTSPTPSCWSAAGPNCPLIEYMSPGSYKIWHSSSLSGLVPFVYYRTFMYYVHSSVWPCYLCQQTDPSCHLTHEHTFHHAPCWTGASLMPALVPFVCCLACRECLPPFPLPFQGSVCPWRWSLCLSFGKAVCSYFDSQLTLRFLAANFEKPCISEISLVILSITVKSFRARLNFVLGFPIIPREVPRIKEVLSSRWRQVASRLVKKHRKYAGF